MVELFRDAAVEAVLTGSVWAMCVYFHYAIKARDRKFDSLKQELLALREQDLTMAQTVVDVTKELLSLNELLTELTVAVRDHEINRH